MTHDEDCSSLEDWSPRFDCDCSQEKSMTDEQINRTIAGPFPKAHAAHFSYPLDIGGIMINVSVQPIDEAGLAIIEEWFALVLRGLKRQFRTATEEFESEKQACLSAKGVRG